MSQYHTDFVLNEIIKLVEQDSVPSALLYFSDHSEDVVSNKAHNPALFTYEMVEIPMLFWANDKWRQKNKVKWLNLKNNQQKDFSNDHIFETISGLMGASSPEIQTQNDLSSQDYEEEELTTLHGHRKIRNTNNVAYWQRKNLSKLRDTDDCIKLLPHRVNTIGKASQAIISGACGLEIDIMVEKNDDGYALQVGHDSNTQSNVSLQEFLRKLDIGGIQKIWLDIKNLNNQNIDGTLNRLNQLDSHFNLKGIALIETSFYGGKVKLISEAGYNVSYYLPTRQVLDQMEHGSNAKDNLVSMLVSRVNQMGVKNISFDLRLYPFVKDSLELKLDESSQAYHSWFPEGLSFSNTTLLEDIKAESFYVDPKMKTILLPYSSPYSL